MLGGRSCIASCLLQIWLFSPGSKSAARSGFKPGQRLGVLDGSHTSIRLAATSPSHFCEVCVCLLQMVGGGGASPGVVRVSTCCRKSAGDGEPFSLGAARALCSVRGMALGSVF
jgi:hypothetical protein